MNNKTIREWISRHPAAIQGDAYCYHPKSVRVDDLVFVDEWHTSGAVTIYQASDPATEWEFPDFGRDASINGARAKALYRPKSGTLEKLWIARGWVTKDESLKAKIMNILKGQ